MGIISYIWSRTQNLLIKIKKSLVILRHGSFKAGVRILLKTAQIIRIIKEYSWITGHSEDCSMVLIKIIRSEITVLNIATLMLSRKRRENERRRSKSQEPERPELRRKLALRGSKYLE
jgi:hypothetical protein